ncbi:FecR domain-containing protein [Parapedobacter defluvii]|uniref:FecR family protein n=1 Tax=Parapedobacter defluvii TaxID=2045106 RepID=UPI00333EC1F8
MGNSEIWELIAKHLSGESTTEEEVELASWINSSEVNRRIYEQVEQAWAESQRDSAPQRLARGKAMVFGRIRRDKHSWWKRTSVVSQVAAALLVVALSWYGYTKMQPQNQAVALRTVQNDGEPKELLLPDGSTVWLNSKSQIRYADNFSGKTREIFLKGEAFFDIKRDESKPFIVHAGSLATQVMGTSFNIRAYVEWSDIEVTVSSGKVSVSDSTGVIGELVSDQQLSYQKSTGRFTRQLVKSRNASLWKEGELIFDAETFEEVAQILERRYQVHIQFDNNKIKNRPVSARFSKDESLQQILYMVGLVTNTEAMFNDGTDIRIRGKN